MAGLRETLRRLKAGEAVLIFPEGTRSRDGQLGTLKPGFCALAKRARVPLVPVAIEGAYEAWPRWRMFPVLGTIDVQFGAPISATEAAAFDDRDLVREVERRIRLCQTLARNRRASRTSCKVLAAAALLLLVTMIAGIQTDSLGMPNDSADIGHSDGGHPPNSRRQGKVRPSRPAVSDQFGATSGERLKATWRRYSEGPLTAEDFAAKPPDPLPNKGGQMLASTDTAIQHTYRYRLTIASGTYRAIAKKIEFFAVCQPSTSWNVKPQEESLLAHEQGHFDLSEIHARHAQREIAKLVARGDVFGSGTTKDQALNAMIEELQRRFQPIIDEWHLEERRYDAETRHGMDPVQQHEWQRMIDLRLKSKP
jgi:hypothetical protein